MNISKEGEWQIIIFHVKKQMIHVSVYALWILYPADWYYVGLKGGKWNLQVTNVHTLVRLAHRRERGRARERGYIGTRVWSADTLINSFIIGNINYVVQCTLQHNVLGRCFISPLAHSYLYTHQRTEPHTHTHTHAFTTDTQTHTYTQY